MKRVIHTLFLCVAAFSAAGQDIEVTVKNIKNDQGVLVVGLFVSEKTFTKHPLKAEKPKAEAGTLKVIFRNVEPGDYAISIFHDANENGILDMNFMGMPKEGFGFSNDAMGVFGPPTFSKAKF
jgi:uncharacterized protein (DUF2141 family)